ncbi:molybdenum cofactor biosynthesis protein MoaE [soil metagenome]
MQAGEPGARWHTGITDQPLSLDDAAAFVADRRAGATVTFTGVVRDHAHDDETEALDPASGAPARPVTGLDYEAYTEVAEQRLAELAAEVSAKWPDLLAGWAVHRVGQLLVGDTAVVVAVSSPHRDTAFEAGRHMIDTLKATVPIWKREHWADGGSHWPGTD